MTRPTKSLPVGDTAGFTTANLVAFLRTPDAYARQTAHVEVRETHMSWVFLTEDRVYKLKKPVRFSFLDFSTLAARETSCRDEVRLNRRLAPDVYLGAVPITGTIGRRLELGGTGPVVDWLVEMRRLPPAEMLDRAVQDGTVTAMQIDRLGGLLTQFFRRAQRAATSPQAYVAHFRRQNAENRRLLCDRRFGLATEQAKPILDRLQSIVVRAPDWLQEPARHDRIIDGHGDLRPEHVCLSDPPVIIDCLEFNRTLRLVDPFDEIAFLGLECEMLGASWIGRHLLARCAKALGTRPPDRLIAFYTAIRACLRARLAVAHLLDPAPRAPDRWLPLAMRYLEIADAACLKLPLPEARRSTRFRDDDG